MRNAMKKFVAVVLTFAMLLGMTTVAFATTQNHNIVGYNPEWPVSLRVHHTRAPGLDDPNVISPGFPSPLPGPSPIVPGLGAPVVGAHWFAQRLTIPAGNISDAEMSAVQNFIINGVGALPEGWYMTSAVIGPIETTSAGLAYFPAGNATTAGTIQHAVANVPTGAGFAACTNAMGHGSWFVWEELSGQANCPHTGTNRQFVNVYNNAEPPAVIGQELATSTIHNPFFVDLPTWVHRPNDNIVSPPVCTAVPPAEYPDLCDNPTCPLCSMPPGYWVQNVNVFPKPASPPPMTKEPGTAVPGVVNGRYVNVHPWTIEVGIPSAMATMVTNPDYPATSTDPQIPALNPLFHPINNPPGGPLPVSLAGSEDPDVLIGEGNLPATAGVHPNSFIVIRDILDYRTRLYDQHATLVGLDAIAHHISINITNLAGADVPLLRGDHWQLVSHEFEPGDTLPGGGVVPATVEFYPGQTPPGAHPGVQVFWIHFLAGSLELLHPHANNEDARISVDFRTVVDLEVGQLGVVENDFDLYISHTPGYRYGDNRPGGGLPGEEFYGIRARKVNQTGAYLEGAVFYLFRADQMQAPNAQGQRFPLGWDGTNRPANLTTAGSTAQGAALAAPIRTTVSGAPVDDDPISVTVPTALGGGTYTGQLGQTAGLAFFNGLPAIQEIEIDDVEGFFPNSTHADARNRVGAYYIFELYAPDGYRSIDGFRRIEIIAPPSPNSNVTVGDPNAEPPIEGVLQLVIVVTNTREFELPLTGGAGTIMFTAAGVSLMGGAGLFLFLARKKEKVQK